MGLGNPRRRLLLCEDNETIYDFRNEYDDILILKPHTEECCVLSVKLSQVSSVPTPSKLMRDHQSAPPSFPYHLAFASLQVQLSVAKLLVF